MLQSRFSRAVLTKIPEYYGLVLSAMTLHSSLHSPLCIPKKSEKVVRKRHGPVLRTIPVSMSAEVGANDKNKRMETWTGVPVRNHL